MQPVPDEVFEDEPKDSDGLVQVIKEDVSPRDVFVLGKQVLLAVGIFFLLIASVRIYTGCEEGAKDVWEFGKVFLNSVASLVLGYYFGKRDK